MSVDVEVFQEGMSQRHTARCECGWQSSVGSLKAAQDLAREHRQVGCPSQISSTATAVVPAAVTVGAWTGDQMEIIRRSVAPGSTNDELAFFAQVCHHKGLDPFAGEIVAIQRWDRRAGRNVLVIQETVAGLRALAERSGLYNGQDPPLWCGPDARWVEVWLDTHTPPAAAKVAVYRKGWDRPTVGIARFSSYVQLDKDGRPAGLWKTGPDFMLWKCAEAAALKRAFKHALADAGLSARELSGPSRISMEARAAGLDDDARHALVADITDGRTDSTRDLTDQEALEVRAEIARISAEVNTDPNTGEITSVPEEEPDAVARTIARAAADLEQRLERLTPTQMEEIKTFRRAHALTRPLGTLTASDRARIASELDRREREGWVTPTAEEPPADEQTDIVSGDVVEPDLFDDEPF